jgi:hypothetical protein
MLLAARKRRAERVGATLRLRRAHCVVIRALTLFRCWFFLFAFVCVCRADFLYASSCVPGYISWTNTATGSWYITALCNVLLSYWPTMHLGQIQKNKLACCQQRWRSDEAVWLTIVIALPMLVSFLLVFR